MKLLLALLLFCACAAAQDKPVIDKAFVAVNAAQTATAFLDSWSTARFFDKCRRYGLECYEMNPLLGKHPSNASLYGWAGGSSVGFAVLSYYWKKHWGSTWVAVPSGLIVGHGVAFTINLRHASEAERLR